MTNRWWNQLRHDVIDADLCTQCGTCVGLSNGLLEFQERKGIPLPIRTSKEGDLPGTICEGCPARRCLYPELNAFVFGTQPQNMLAGMVRKTFVGHASDEAVRRNSASGGILSALLIHLLETGRIRGAVCLQVGKTVPWRAEPVFARTREDVLRCAQSVYSVTPVNTILGTLEQEEGPLAYVGLPDQVASIRKLQKIKHPAVRNIAYVLGPYMGTQMYFGAVRSFLRSHGIRSEEEITRLRYRAGEWPGHLEIALKNGHVLRAAKFHYNYLIPFFITKSSLQLVDFTNELTDISVGDAWSPRYEAERGGHSVILARSKQGVELLEEMRGKELLTLEEITLAQALDMHGHMLDFKKRGSFIRNRWKKAQPDYGYAPASIPFSRIFVEWCLRLIFGFGRTALARWIVEHLPLSIVGPCFNVLRKSWKSVSKPTKRRGLRETQFLPTPLSLTGFTIQDVRSFWDSIATEYDRINRDMGWTHTERFETMCRFLPSLQGTRIINVWSRTGSAVPWIRKKCPGAVIINLEVSGNLLAIAKERYPAERFELTDLRDFPLADGSQDVVVSLETLEHAPDPLEFLRECRRVLKPGGCLILSCPPAWSEVPLRIYERFFENHGEGPHRFPAVTEVLRRLRACGFTVLEHRGSVLLPVGPAWLKRGVEWLQQSLLRHVGTNRLGIRHFYICETTAHRNASTKGCSRLFS